AKHERVRPGVETFRFGGAQGSEDENRIRVVPAEVGNTPKPTVHFFGDRGMPTIRVLLVLSPEIGPQMGIASKYLPLGRVCAPAVIENPRTKQAVSKNSFTLAVG